jgi:hypothetical protein
MSITNADAAIWAFAHLVARGRVAAASTLLAQQQVVRRAINPNVPSPELVAISILIGNFREKDEPHIPQTFRGRQLDTLLARLADFASVEPIASHLPLLLDFIAAAADTTRRRLRDVFPAADALAKSGKPRLAFEIASNVITNDSTLESVAAAYPWYRSANEALSAARLKTQARFHGGSATISADRIVLEWRVDDSTRFVRYGAELPVNRAEYRFDVIIEGASRYYRFTAAAAPKPVGAAPFSATLAEILPPSAGRQVVGGNIRNGIQADTTVLQNVVLRTEFAPGILRFVVSDPAMIEVLRRERPAQARFRFYPCAVTVGVVGASRCVDERIPVTYTP